MSGIKGESIALYPLKTKAVWFAGSLLILDRDIAKVLQHDW